jgi:uncharacterized membrane protein YphA (DoxX/SURF4 family)
MAPNPERFLASIGIKIKHSNLFYLLSRLLLGGVFLYAGLGKIPNPQDFAVAMANYRLLPAAYVTPGALILPWLEVLCGLFLICGLFTRACAWVLLVLLLVFMGALTSALVRGLDIACGCFDLKYKVSSYRDMLNYLSRDLILVFFSCQIISSSSRQFSLSRFLPRNFKRLME